MRRSPRSIHEALDEHVYMGDRVRFRTSSRETKTWYLVRDISKGHMPAPRWARELPDGIGGWALLRGTRGGEYVATWAKKYPGPQYELWLYRMGRAGLGDRTRLTGLEHDPAEQHTPDYLSDYISDAHIIEAWPNA